MAMAISPAQAPELSGRKDRFEVHADVVIVTLAMATLAVSIFLPWYTLWAERCGQYRSLAVSQISAGGWRLDLLLCGLVAWISVLFNDRFRVATIVGAWVTFVLALSWWLNSPGLEIEGVCTKAPHGSLSLHSGTGSGVGPYISIGACLAMIYGAHLRSRRLKLNKAK
jgi:hypothetical protein